MNLNTVADHAAQVITGRIATVRSYWADHPRRIESEVTLENVEYLKGALSGGLSTFTLVVPGGKIGAIQMRIAGAPVFHVGEQWVLCLLPTYRTFPVVGVSQGAFRITPDDGGMRRVFSAEMQPVIGIDDRGFIQLGRTRLRPASERLVGAERVHLRDEQRAVSTGKAMTYRDFMTAFLPILDGSRHHRLTGPAGARVPVRYTPVPPRRRTGVADRPRRSRPGGGG